MTDKRYYWIKLRQDFYDNNDAIDFLMGQKNGSEYIVLYQMLCLRTVNSGGKLCSQIGEMIIPYDVDKIVRECKYFSRDTVILALELYKRVGLIYEEDNNCLAITDFNKFIGSESESAERVRKFRAKGALQCNGNVTGRNEKCNAECNTDIDNREKSKDKDKDINKDINKNILVSSNLLSYDKVLEIAKAECPTCYNRYQKKIDSGKLEYANRLTQILDDLQGQYDYEAIRQLLRHANKTYIVSPNYQSLDLIWVLSNIEKVKQTEARDDNSCNGNGGQYQAAQPPKGMGGVTTKTVEELQALWGEPDPEEI